MNCDEIKKELDSYHDGELGADLRARIEAHLAGCAECRVGLKAIDSIEKLVMKAPEAEISPWFEQRLMNRIRAEEGRRWIFGALARPAFAASAALLLIFTIRLGHMYRSDLETAMPERQVEAGMLGEIDLLKSPDMDILLDDDFDEIIETLGHEEG